MQVEVHLTVAETVAGPPSEHRPAKQALDQVLNFPAASRLGRDRSGRSVLRPRPAQLQLSPPAALRPVCQPRRRLLGTGRGLCLRDSHGLDQLEK